jgi:hypothetical protein
VAHRRLAMPSGSGGGAVTSDLGSLAATLARVLRGEVCGIEGGFYRRIAWQRGQEIDPNRGDFSR